MSNHVQVVCHRRFGRGLSPRLSEYGGWGSDACTRQTGQLFGRVNIIDALVLLPVIAVAAAGATLVAETDRRARCRRRATDTRRLTGRRPARGAARAAGATGRRAQVDSLDWPRSRSDDGDYHRSRQPRTPEQVAARRVGWRGRTVRRHRTRRARGGDRCLLVWLDENAGERNARTAPTTTRRRPDQRSRTRISTGLAGRAVIDASRSNSSGPTRSNS